MARVNVAKKHTSDNGVVIEFTNGHQVALDLAELDSDIITRLAVHGLSQKLGDSYSGCGGDLNIAIAAAESTKEALLKGDWAQRGVGDGGYLAEAVAEITGQGLDTVREKLATLSDEQKDALKKRKDVKAVVARLKAEKLAERAEDEAPLEL